jgi:hypothetical protein
MKLNKSLPNAIYRNGKKLGYNRSFNTIVEARKFVALLKEYPYRHSPYTQIRKVVSTVGGKRTLYAVYSTDY